MNVEGWTVLIRWERALQFQAHLAVQRDTTQLQALARHVNESLGLPAEIQRIMNTHTGMGMIEAFVSMQARGNPAVWAVARAIDAVRRTDAAAARAWQSRLKSRLEGCRAIVSRLKAEGSLRPELDPSIAADLLWTMTSLRMWEDLVLEREWSPEQYQVYVTNVLIGALTSSRFE